jgi:PASTA domain
VRIGVALAALVVGALAAAWHFRGGDEAVRPEQPPVLVQPGDKARPVENRRASRVTRRSGLQTTVPDTLGYDEQTAIRVLEDGGFRVRVTNWKVASLRDEGIVVQQLPRGGVTRRVDWIVTIVVGIPR